MERYWRDVLLAAVAWLCGAGALRLFPGTSSFRPEHFSDWFTLAMFKPIPLLVSGILFAAGTTLACRLIARNASGLWRLLRCGCRDALFHLVALTLALFVLAVQLLKAPAATALMIGGIAAAGTVRALRKRSVRMEISAWQSRKERQPPW